MEIIICYHVLRKEQMHLVLRHDGMLKPFNIKYYDNSDVSVFSYIHNRRHFGSNKTNLFFKIILFDKLIENITKK